MDKDAMKLAEMGYKPELRRNFSIWSVLGVGFGLTNSWFGISASLVTGISSGGPLLIVYGIIIIACISTCIAITLSELSSAFPNSGGQYYWTTILAPRRYAPFLAYMCGALSFAGAIFTSASVTVAIATAVVGMYALQHPGFVPQTWQIFVTYQLLNLITFFFNCYGKALPHIGKGALYVSLFSFVTISLTVLICSRGHYQDPSFVFVDFNNNTGWSSAGIAFIVGLINPNWSFSCLDCATHMAEEVAEPERIIPISIMGTVAIGFATSFCYVIAMFFSIRNLDAILQSTTGVPILDIFYQSLGSVPGALCLEALIVLTAMGCNIASHTWQARLSWSFSRDHGLPGSKWWSKVDPKLGVPFNAHAMACTWCAIVGCLYMASTTAFNAMVTGCIIFLLLSYLVPTACLLWRRRQIPHGPFWLGPVGLFANIVVVLWTIFTTIFFSFPFEMPVNAGNMNYVCVVIVVYVAYCIVYWKLWGKKTFRVHDSPLDQEQAANNLARVMNEAEVNFSSTSASSDEGEKTSPTQSTSPIQSD
ncbi:choline transport protein [Trichomonascus vanleenenianus]|uniref:Hnm1p n=1 Tax=Trichomonascus vanleenenianus TaxID=2268995 RepID=UPI003ECB139C